MIAEDLEDNLAEVVTEVDKQRTLMEATFAVTARVFSLSLLDFV